MKKLFILMILIIPTISFCQISLPEINGEEDWENVIITKNPNDIIGLTRVDNVNGEAMKIYGKQSKLRTAATEQIKRVAAKKGASIVYVTLDNFEMTPLNNVQMEGTAYKKTDMEENVESKQTVEKNISQPSIDLPIINREEDWEKVIITKNPNDIIGLTRVDNVNGEAMKIYGKQSKLRTAATEQIKRAAAKKGAEIIYVTLDNFEMTPLNNVQMEGTAYKKTDMEESVESKQTVEKNISQPSIDLPIINREEDWEKVIITKNPNDIIGLTRVDNVNGEAMKIYGKQSKLRTAATEQIKRAAAKKGAEIIYVTLDNFEMTPLNNVQMEGTAYKK